MNQDIPDVVVKTALTYTQTTNLTDAILALMDAEIKQCADETCQKAFIFQEGRSTGQKHRNDAIYCSAICGRRTTQRAYKRRVRKAKREQGES